VNELLPFGGLLVANGHLNVVNALPDGFHGAILEHPDELDLSELLAGACHYYEQ